MLGKRRRLSRFFSMGKATGTLPRKRYKAPIFRRINAGRLVQKQRRKNLVKLIKSVQLNNNETKYKSISQSTSALNHNTLTEIMKLWDNVGNGIFPSQQVTDGDRIGDEIQAVGIMIRGQIEIPYDRRDTVCDIYYVTNNTAVGGVTKGTLFHNVTGNVMLDPIQTKRFSQVKKCGRYRCRPSDAGMHSTGAWLADNVITKTIHFKKWIPLKRNVKFVADASTVAANLPELGGLYMACADTLSTASGDNVVASVDCTATLYYKDP